MTQFTLATLAAIIDERAKADPTESYTAKLLARGPAKCAQKLGEEGVEAAIALVKGDRQELTKEAADILYHLVVVLKSGGVSLDEVMNELADRTGQSGLQEKASRHGD